MDNNDSKSQQTGGLKLMTVFIAVLALHVVVIGGFTVYHLMSGGSTDADMVATDKTHKDKSTDGDKVASTTPDASQPDKAPATTQDTTAPSNVASTTPAPTAPDATGPNEIVPPTPGPAPVLQPTKVPAAPIASTVPTTTANEKAKPVDGSKLAPITLTTEDSANNAKMSQLAPLVSDVTPATTTTTMTPAPAITPAPAVTPTPAITSATPSGPVASAGPVHMPPAEKAPSPTHVDLPTYTVKITDSYKKIAAAHHITVAQLKSANHIKDDTLHTGQKLIIPAAGKSSVASSSHTDATPKTLSLADVPASSAPAPKPAASTSTAKSTAGSEAHTYTIAKGDTLNKIAHKFNTTAAAIMAKNNITDPAKLTIGKKLKIPSKESRSAGNSVPTPTPIEPAVQPVPQQPPQVQTKADDASAQLANYHGDTSF